MPQEAVAHVAVLPDGRRVTIDPPPHDRTLGRVFTPRGVTTSPNVGSCRLAPLGSVVGARSGDKGGDANLGVWARSDTAFAWLRAFLTVDKLRELVPEAAPLPVDRYELPNLRALNFVVHGLLGQGVAASTRFDPQGKALGEFLRSRTVEVPDDV